ncbi:MAG: sigma-54 dependent transcriptional regulator [Anaerolineales bacterium]|nr:sigma-54 dependent transcriptional regulator [Anaerolineales bacterium]MCS7247794.1 sigma-54 dependent transcriptional regulator [Anaerolineales bacterium]MDW8161604.1 sigma-54 dependent transcriptional regulator [Anaerolineales bacterium]MDW8448343.1 sigma-54 dependent transcriptional regulator [Anaerolineales bacterium]
MAYTVLMVEDEEDCITPLLPYIQSRGYEVKVASTLRKAREYLNQGVGDIVLLDVLLPDGNGLDLLHETASLPTRPSVIVFTGHGDIEMAVEAMKLGATDFLQKPVVFSQIEKSLQRAAENVALRRELNLYRQAQLQSVDFIIGNSPIMRRLYEQAQRAALASVSVLITGETGSGKSLLAKAIHKMGPRANKPFVHVDCGAIPASVFESELFGHEAGAFTSAEKRKLGLLETADGGVLFLDEISSMPIETQAKLLRALDEQSFRRLGSTTEIKVDVQVLAASNRNLRRMMEEGTFRSDLYYRLKVVDLEVPPLREHKEDIPELVGFLIRKNNPRRGTNIRNVTPRAMEALMAYDWPGNIRELAHAIERAMIFCDDEAIDLHHLPYEVQAMPARQNSGPSKAPRTRSGRPD